MLSKIKFLLPVIAGVLLLQGCNKGDKDGFYTTEDGLMYKIYEQTENGEYKDAGKISASDTSGARIGEVMTFHWQIKNGEDSVFADTRTQGPGMPIVLPLMEPSMKGGLENALAMMSPGDSGVFKINADSLFANSFQQPLPPFIKPGSMITFFIKVDKVQSRAEAEADYMKMMEEQMKESQTKALGQIKVDDEKLQAYIKENNLSNVKKTDSGIYYKITQEGKGPQAKAGDEVSVHYTLSFLNGKQLETSRNNPNTQGAPFTFTLGQGQVIKGWDEGIAQLNKGSKAILLIPSPLAYGDQERGPDMPANSILRFDVELVDVNSK
jgi:FKBP-type peptidyl-prolyl cis-trans isomerase FkpA